ncbi:MAG: hypothetical protein AAGG81_05355 [Chlamydiota bacterium]
MVQLLTCIFLFFCCLIPNKGVSAIPADISFVIIDLKYNEKDGVKICEVQEAIGSRFFGVEFLSQKKGEVAERLTDILARYTHRLWYYTPGISQEFLPLFRNSFNCKGIFSINGLLKDKSFTKYNKKRVKSPFSLSDYHGIIVSHYEHLSPAFVSKMKGVLILNKAFLPHFGSSCCTDKLPMSLLFDHDKELKALKPKWKLYEKQYSKEFVDEILNDFSTDYLVIKPRIASRGRGVLIIRRNQLDETLQYIFGDCPKLTSDPDNSYHYWDYDQRPDFLVEEFYQSTPVTVSHLGNKPYDGTVRIPTVFTYNQGKVDVDFLYIFWKFPRKSLDDDGTLTETHKSFSGSQDHFELVDPKTKANIEIQIKEPLLKLYQRLVQ